MRNIYILSSGYKGGVTTFIKQQIEYLEKKKKKIYVIDDNPFVTFKDISQKKVKFYSIDISKNYFSAYQKLTLLFSDRNKDLRCLLITNYAIFIKFFFFFLLLRKKNYKIILSLHSGLLNFTFKSYIAAFLFSFLSNKVDKLIFGSKSCKNWWFNKFPWFANKNYKIIYNGIDIPKKKIILKNKKKLNVSFVGRLEKENNVDLFLQLAKESYTNNNFFNFHLFGDGSLLKKLKKKYSSYAKFHNWKKVSDIYKITDLLVITSKINNFPYVALEAKSYGVPVLSCSKGDINKIINNGKDGYLISNSNSTELLKYLNIIKKRYSSLVKYSLKSRYKFNLESSCKKFWQSII
jgi:glycosyltransferase involved in cell wall biosynthesis